MKKLEFAKLLYEMADILDIQGVDWKPQALRKAARNIETLPQDIEDVYRKEGEEGLRKIPGVGEGIAKKIIEYLKTGRLKEYDELKKLVPKGVEELMSVQGLGPKKAWKLYKELNIDSLEKLEKLAKEGKIRKIEGFGQKSEEDILRGLELVRKGKERMLLGTALPIANEIVEKLRKSRDVKRAELGGSIRRRKETIGDIDILVISDKPLKVMDYFTSLPDVQTVLAKGDTKSSVVLKEGLNCDLRVLEEKQYGAALMYFTGSKDHNIVLRNVAIRKGMKLSEYGLFDDKTGKLIASKTEEEIYKKLGMDYIEPEMREVTGEIELAQKHKLPDLIKYNSVKGDLHTHTNWSDGQYSTEDMIKAAIKMGYKYIAITDHSKSERVANGLEEKRLLQHLAEIDKLQKKYPQIKIFKGSEVDIMGDGRLDYDDNILKQLDVVIASVHSRFKSTKEEMTKRVLNALNNRYVNILAHPTGRLINQREPYEIDLDKVFQKAKDNGIIVEVNSYPARLDLNDVNIKRAIEFGLKLTIDTDSHSIDHLRFIEFGIAQARRGWATEKDIINTWPTEKLRKVLER